MEWASAAGAVGGGFMNAGGGLASSALNWYYTKKAAKLKYEYDQKYALNTPSWNKSGYEKAGLNPMLAMGNANSAAQSGMAINGNQASGSNLGALGTGAVGAAGAVAGIVSAIKDNEKKDAEIKNIKEQTRLTKATADIEGQKVESGYGTQQGYLVAAQVQHLTESANLSREQAMKVVAEAENIRAGLESINLGNELLKEKIVAQSTSNSKSALELERSVMDMEALRTLIVEDPNILTDALAGRFGAEAKQSAKTISEIVKNASEAGSKITDIIPIGKLGKLFGSIFESLGKKGKLPAKIGNLDLPKNLPGIKK